MSQRSTLRDVTAEQKRFGKLPWPQTLNDPKSLTQSPSGTSGLESIHSRSALRSPINANRAVTHAVNQMLAYARPELRPGRDLRHQSPKTIRPI